MVTMKRCVNCGERKPLSAFHKHTKSKDGVQSWCKECCNFYTITYNRQRYMAARSFGFELHTDVALRRNSARFTCVECSKTLDLTITGRLNPEGLANSAKYQGWDAHPWQPQESKCPDCKARPKINDPNSELKKLEAKMAQTPNPPPAEPVVPLREATQDQRTMIRALLDKNFNEAGGYYMADYSDQRVAEEANVPRVVVERLRDTAYGPIKISPETMALRNEIAALTTKLDVAQRDAEQLAQILRREIEEVRAALDTLNKRAAEVKAA